MAKTAAGGVRSANRILAARAKTNAALDGSGATLAAALFGDDELAVSNVGDCRAYLLRDGQLSQITHDPSVVAEQVAPIELSFAKLKAIVRAARWRSIETLWPLLGACVPRFTPAECRASFRHCGYSGAVRS